MTDINEERKKHRVIGIRHTLRVLKNDGLIDDDTMYPDEAVDDIKEEILSTAKKWYRIGARRGARVMLKAIIKGDFETIKDKDGSVYISANRDNISWTRTLTVKTGKEKKTIKSKKYRITIEELDFE